MKHIYLTFLLTFSWSLNLMALPLDIENLKLFEPKSQGMKNTMSSELDEVITQFIEDEKIQGAVVAVSRFGNPIYFSAHGLADVPNKIAMERDAMFQMWSSTKPVLGVAAMIAIERGLFSPEDEVGKYLPNFKGIEVAVLDDPKDKDVSPLGVYAQLGGETGFFSSLYWRVWSWFSDGYYLGYIPEHRLVKSNKPITIHHLLTHTAGLGTNGLGQAIAPWNAKLTSSKDGGTKEENAFLNNMTIGSLTDMISEGPLDFQPGSRFSYSGFMGLDVVAHIIEITSGQPFEEFVKTNIFDPLYMHDTYWNVPSEKFNRIVSISGGGKDGSKPPGETKFFSGSVGLISTAKDYLHFENMLLNQGEFLGKRILSEASVKLMSTNQTGDLYSKIEKMVEGAEGFGYTVSVTLDPEKALIKRGKGSFGWAGAAGTMSWTDPVNDINVVIMVQQPTKEFPEDIARVVFDSVGRATK
jgi:CubicO group peptidase (beta-lactamase class C family)